LCSSPNYFFGINFGILMKEADADRGGKLDFSIEPLVVAAVIAATSFDFRIRTTSSKANAISNTKRPLYTS